jgi:hypothetical protein
MLYMLLICYDPTVPARSDQQNLQPKHAELERELRDRGIFISGAGLWPLEMSKSVRTGEGEPLVTDGPFAETKEAVGGYYIVDCDEPEALAIASRIPVGSDAYIQVRRIALFHPDVERIAQWAAQAGAAARA